MAFFECQFPVRIGFGATGGPGWSTIVNKGFSGFEQRNRNWSSVRNSYQLDLVARPLAEYQTIMDFFINVGGQADAFRFLDVTDFTATSQFIATGDGITKIFQLQKTYLVGSGAGQRTYTRIISKPIMSVQTFGGTPITDFAGVPLLDTVVMFVNGVKKINGTDYTVDATTGLVTFTTAPVNGATITANFQFHVPVRFNSDEWPAQVVPSDVLDGNALVTVTGILLLEVRIVPGQSQG